MPNMSAIVFATPSRILALSAKGLGGEGGKGGSPKSPVTGGAILLYEGPGAGAGLGAAGLGAGAGGARGVIGAAGLIGFAGGAGRKPGFTAASSFLRTTLE